MARHTSALSLYQAQLKRFEQVKGDAGAAMREAAYEGWRDHLALTSGGIKSAQLRRMGAPYGRGPSAAQNLGRAGNVGRRGATGRGKAPLRPINVQSGRLRMSVRMHRYRRGVYDVQIGGGTGYARYILHPAGTRKMVGRGVLGWRNVNRAFPMGEVERRHRMRNRAMRDALNRSWRSRT